MVAAPERGVREVLTGGRLMWTVLDLDGNILESFPSGRRGWLRAVRFAEREGGELDIVFMPYVSREAAA